MPSSTEQPQLLAQRPVQLRGSALARAVLRLLGWQVEFDGLPARQGMLVFYPHTSNWDFPLAMLTKWAIGLNLSFLGKDSLFRVPLFGRWLRWIGGVPVNRHNASGVVDQMVSALQKARKDDSFLWLGLSPEGTRSGSRGWRSGFYRATLGADVPLVLAFVDYPSRRIGVAACLQLCGQPEADMASIRSHLAHRRGKRPEHAAPVQMDAPP